MRVRTHHAVTMLLPVPRSDTACTAWHGQHLSGMQWLGYTGSPVRRFSIPSHAHPVHDPWA
jgi:hypothetical protein